MKAALPLLLLALFLSWSGCAHLDPGADAVEVRAEQTIQTAHDTLHAFLLLDNADRALAQAKAPAAHHFAEYLRQSVTIDGEAFPRWIALIESATKTRLAYKLHRDAEHRLTLSAAVDALTTALSQAQNHLAALKTP